MVSSRPRSLGWGRRAGRGLALALLALGMLVAGSGAALANEEETDEASLLVLQSVALIANGAPVEAVEERIGDALEAPDQTGTDMAAVEEAAALVEPGATRADLEEARELLVGAIDVRFASGYGEIPSPRELGHDESPYASGGDTGTTAVVDELQPARGISDGGDAVLLSLAVLAVIAGLVLARRWRPHDTIRQLRHRTTRPEEAR